MADAGGLDLGRLARAAGLGRAQLHLQELRPNGRTWAEDDGRYVYPASLIKLPLAAAAAIAVEAGRLAWTTPITVTAANMTVNDTPSPMAPGYVATVDELVTLMLQRSDNVATNQLFDVLDRDHATADVRAHGLTATRFRRKLSGALPLIADPRADGRNAFPAADCMTLLRGLDDGALPGAAHLRAIMQTSYWDVKLSRGLEPNDRFAHKTGDTSEGSHDAGLLTLAGGSRWAIAVYTELPSSDDNDMRFGTFMRALRPLLLSA